jgi:hypothetical protein
VKAQEVALQSLQAVPWRRGEISQFVSIIQHVELSGSDLGNPSPTDSFGDNPFYKESLDGPAKKALYRHPKLIYLYKVYLVKVIGA